jgi:Cu/Zn superoxide dismutase
MKILRKAPYNRKFTRTLVYMIVVVLVLVAALPALASSGEVTSGEFHTFATGVGRGYDIAGHAHMTRTASGKTIVKVHATGLAANTVFGVHVHNKACNEANGGGHYQDVVGGEVDQYNEIWPLFTTNAAGIGNGMAKNDFYARPEAQSVVIHDTDGARIACADLE